MAIGRLLGRYEKYADAPVMQARSVVRAGTAVACSVTLIDAETDALRLAGSFGLPEGYTAAMQASWEAGVRSPTVRVFRSRQPLLLRDARRALLSNPLYAPIHPLVRDAAWDTGYIVPLISRGQALGAINVYFLPGEEPKEDEKTFLGAIADQTAVAVENAQLAVLRRPGQGRLRTTIRCEEPDISPEAKEALYRVAQEALHNTVKHALASNVELLLECGANGVTLEISDDGVGFDPTGSFPGHLGLRSMRERATRLGGTLKIESEHGKGIRLRARIPSGRR